MNTDDIFKNSAQRQIEITERQNQDALDEKARQKDQASNANDHAVAINARLQSGLSYLSTEEFPKVKGNGYDIQHNFRFSRHPNSAVQQLYGGLDLYMSRGAVTHRLDGNPPYQADHELMLSGDESSGAIDASFRSHASGRSEQLGTFGSADELSDSRLRDIFQTFIKLSLECEEQRAATAKR